MASLSQTLYGQSTWKLPYKYKSPYSGQPLDNRGLPRNSTYPDQIQNNTPPTLSQQSGIAKNRIFPTTNQPKTMEYTPLGVPGSTPVSNIVPTADGTSFDSTYTGINTTPTSNPAIPQVSINSTGQYVAAKKPKPKPKPKKRPNYADSEYQSELRAIEKALAAYKSKMGVNRTRAGTQYSTSTRDLKQQKDRDLENLKDDFAARGIVLSGVYGDKVGEYNTLWGQQNSELSRQYKDALSDLTRNYNEYLQQVAAEKEQARLAAVRRRAQKLGKL